MLHDPCEIIIVRRIAYAETELQRVQKRYGAHLPRMPEREIPREADPERLRLSDVSRGLQILRRGEKYRGVGQIRETTADLAENLVEKLPLQKMAAFFLQNIIF